MKNSKEWRILKRLTVGDRPTFPSLVKTTNNGTKQDIYQLFS